jgi:polysaccharide pyruvyl transferase WcaK-like protein
MKKLLFNGFYGFKNSGDDVFVEVSSWGANTYWGTNNNTFLSTKVPQTVCPTKKLSRPLFKGYNRLQCAFLSYTSDCFISAGGSTFSRHLDYSLKDIAMRTKLSVKKNLLVGAIGVSVGPFKSLSDELRTTNYIKNMDFLCVRDNRSYEYVSSLNLTYKPVNAFDLAALLPEVYATTKRLEEPKLNSGKIIGISVCNYERYIGGDVTREKSRNEYILNLLRNIPMDDSMTLRFFIFNGHATIGDTELTNEIIVKLGNRKIEIIPYSDNVHQVWNHIAQCDVMISTRLHASILACYAKVPFFLVEYHQKCTDFLNDVGQCETYRLGDAEAHIGEVIESISKILLDENYIKPSNRDLTILKATENFTSVLELMK